MVRLSYPGRSGLPGNSWYPASRSRPRTAVPNRGSNADDISWLSSCLKSHRRTPPGSLRLRQRSPCWRRCISTCLTSEFASGPAHLYPAYLNTVALVYRVFAISKTQQCPFFGRQRLGLMVSQLWVAIKTPSKDAPDIWLNGVMKSIFELVTRGYPLAFTSERWIAE